MESHIFEWLNLLTRWLHFITGVAWIGASFYFNWLENNLDRQAPQDEGIAGNLWAVHGGGFYHLKKFQVAPGKLPEKLHWFKWEAYMTAVSGLALLIVVYYFNAKAYLIDPAVADISPEIGIVIGIVSIVVSWLVYDFLCKSSLRQSPLLLGVLIFIWFAVLAFVLSQLLSSRAAYIHVGAAIGVAMVANVFFVIIPAQKELVTALIENRQPDLEPGKNGLLRSRHNNYLTLPVLFIMISNHFPSTYGNTYNWLLLIAISLISVIVRHYFNVRHNNASLIWILPVAFAAMVGLMWITMPQAGRLEEGSKAVSEQELHAVIEKRCMSCHSNQPKQQGFSAPPLGLAFDNYDTILLTKDKIYNVTVLQKTMPLGNLTGMTDGERKIVETWYLQQN